MQLFQVQELRKNVHYYHIFNVFAENIQKNSHLSLVRKFQIMEVQRCESQIHCEDHPGEHVIRKQKVKAGNNNFFYSSYSLIFFMLSHHFRCINIHIELCDSYLCGLFSPFHTRHPSLGCSLSFELVLPSCGVARSSLLQRSQCTSLISQGARARALYLKNRSTDAKKKMAVTQKMNI